MKRSLIALVSLATIGCHVRHVVDESVPGQPLAERLDQPPVVAPLQLRLADDGFLYASSPMRCASRTVIVEEIYRVTRTEPNIATVIVGLIAGSLGAVGLVAGLADPEPAAAPATWAGVAGLTASLPLVVGPLLGNGVRREHVARDTAPGARRLVPCGERAAAAGAAILAHGRLRVPGRIDERGRFAPSPFAVIDAFALTAVPGVSLTLHTAGGDEIAATLSAAELSAARAGFLQHEGIDARVERLARVPRLEIVAAAQTPTPEGLRVSLTVVNHGPGDAWGVRAQLDGPPPLDGRILYAGALAAGQRQEVTVDIAGAAPRRPLRATLLDAHGTAPRTPVPVKRR